MGKITDIKIPINLYLVYPRSDEWCCYIFAESRNKAKYMIVGHFSHYDGSEYIDYNAVTIKKDVGGSPEVCDLDCDRLKAIGIEYLNDDPWA